MSALRRTLLDWILLAARELSERDTSFTAEDLVVRAWQLAPDQFGLQGHPQYPDSNRVLTKIMGGDSPVRKRGLLRKIGEKRYQLTDVGRRAADDVLSEKNGDGRRLAGLTRDFVISLKRMLRSAALSKFSRGAPLTFSDVSGFWNISPRSSARQFSDRTREADEAIDIALTQAAGDGGRTVLPGDIEIGEGQLRLLRELANHIREKFAGEIAVINSRFDERRL